MLTVDGAFDRIGSVLMDKGYSRAEEKSSSNAGDRVAVFTSREMAVRVGPKGLEESAVDALVRKVGNEVGETSTDSD